MSALRNAAPFFGIVGGTLAFLALLWRANDAVARMFERDPDVFAFITSPWVAPLLILTGVFVIGATAALLVLAGARHDREQGE
ncbi:hypothetical protein [uncultured Novosphingobium sp.]|uniref:hypothetical protein n=1 Tax=uncultured Novosphingobium sp. TaxID=292277 RepID=UPI00374899E5